MYEFLSNFRRIKKYEYWQLFFVGGGGEGGNYSNWTTDI